MTLTATVTAILKKSAKKIVNNHAQALLLTIASHSDNKYPIVFIALIGATAARVTRVNQKITTGFNIRKVTATRCR